MKDLLFNVVVAGALAYLLFGGGDGAPAVRDVVERAAAGAGAVADAGRNLVGLGRHEDDVAAADDAGRKLVGFGRHADDVAAADDTPAPGAAPPGSGASDRIREPVAPPWPLTAGDSASAPRLARDEAPEPSPPRPTVAAARDDSAMPEVPPLSALPGLPAVDDPAVARRRAEVLGTASSGSTSDAKTPPASETGFMSARERQRELYRLAQDMELIFVDKVTK